MVNEVEALTSELRHYPLRCSCLAVSNYSRGLVGKETSWCQELSSFKRKTEIFLFQIWFSAVGELQLFSTRYLKGNWIFRVWVPKPSETNFYLHLLFSLSSYHLLRIYSPISIRVFENLGQVYTWANPTGRMYKDVKNIILRNEKAQETWIFCQNQ